MKIHFSVYLFCLFIFTVECQETWCVQNYGISVCSSVRTAGAIDYVTWNNIQFINAYDHGRELQVAISNMSGECYNPTEAGSSNDSAGPTSSSKLLGLNITSEVFRTTSQPAFWLAPHQYDPNGKCTAVNTEVLSNYIIDKAVTIGYAGYTNALYYLFDVHVPEYQSYLQIEYPTGYMPIAFNTFFTINLATGALSQISAGPQGGETPDPVVISTSDGTAAMGAFLQGAYSQYASYARFSFPQLGAGSTSKWSNVWRSSAPIPANTVVGFASVICLGTLTDVQKCMFAIAQSNGYVH